MATQDDPVGTRVVPPPEWMARTLREKPRLLKTGSPITGSITPGMLDTLQALVGGGVNVRESGPLLSRISGGSTNPITGTVSVTPAPEVLNADRDILAHEFGHVADKRQVFEAQPGAEEGGSFGGVMGFMNKLGIGGSEGEQGFAESFRRAFTAANNSQGGSAPEGLQEGDEELFQEILQQEIFKDHPLRPGVQNLGSMK